MWVLLLFVDGCVENESWREYRQIAVNFYHQNQFIIKKIVHQYADKLVAILDVHAAVNETVDLQAIYHAIIFDAFCEFSFGFTFKISDNWKQEHPFISALETIQERCLARIIQPPLVWTVCRLLNIGNENEINRCRHVLTSFLKPIVQEQIELFEQNRLPKNLLTCYVEYAMIQSVKKLQKKLDQFHYQV